MTTQLCNQNRQC